MPVDIVVTDSIEKPTKIKRVSWESIPHGLMGVDIGDNTIELFTSEIYNARTAFINGPMGVFEQKKFERGTRSVLNSLVGVVENGGYAVAGGGDTLSALNSFGLRGKFSWESTGGGASLQFLEGETLPAIEALIGKKR